MSEAEFLGIDETILLPSPLRIDCKTPTFAYSGALEESSPTAAATSSNIPPTTTSSPTFAYSSGFHENSPTSNTAPPNSAASSRVSETRPSSSSQIDVFVRGSLRDRDILARQGNLDRKPESNKDYKGHHSKWPGVLFGLLLVIGALGSIGYFAVQTHSASQLRGQKYEEYLAESLAIRDGHNKSNKSDDLIEDDGAIGNPKKYPSTVCELPNYMSKNGHIVAVSSNGTEVPMRMKGINWFGMETGQHVPFGLWTNEDNGTTAYQVATFLYHNNFNAVRLPVMISAILENKQPNIYIVNKYENRALDLTTYISTLQSVIKVLQYRHIGVLISLHTLTQFDNGALWYNDDVSETMFLKAVDTLTSSLCSQEYWNVMGLDVKNEPYQGTWGDGGAKDFRAGATRIANRMLKACPNWLAFVEGVNAQHELTIDGNKYGYYDWFGGGLHGAKTKKVELNTPNKVVYAPHYYTPAVFPQYYLYGGGKVAAGNVINNYVELDDDKLRHRIKVTMDDMFGFLADSNGPALLLGEFGGLYSEDAHPKKTTQRCTDFSIEIIKNWAGGFVWSLNPESAYQYNPADKAGNFVEGILQKDWLNVNAKFLNAMAAMDDMENLRQFPCFEKNATADNETITAP